jgi:hypothetical protein
MVCGHDKPFGVWHVSGEHGVCDDCRRDAQAAPLVREKLSAALDVWDGVLLEDSHPAINDTLKGAFPMIPLIESALGALGGRQP